MAMGTSTPMMVPKINLKGISPEQAKINDAMGADYGTEEGDKLLAGAVPQVHTYPGMMGLASIGEGISRGLMLNRIMTNMEGRRQADAGAWDQYAQAATNTGSGYAPTSSPAPVQVSTGGMGRTEPPASAPAAPVAAQPQPQYQSEPESRPAIMGGSATPATGGMGGTTPAISAPAQMMAAQPAAARSTPTQPPAVGGMGMTQPPAQPMQPERQSLTVPRQATPTTVSQDPRAAMVSEQMAQIDRQREHAAELLRSPNRVTQQQGMALMQTLEGRRQHLQDQVIAYSDPTLPLKQRSLEMDLRAKELGLESPAWKIQETGRDKYGNPQRMWVNERTQETKPVEGGSHPDANAGQGLSGDDFLKTLDPTIASQVKGIAEGRLPYPGAFALKQPYWQKVTEALSQYEPGADANTFKTRGATFKDMATGKMGQNVASFNTALGHMHDLYKQIDGLGNWDTMPVMNGPLNAIKERADGGYQAKLKAFDATAEKVISETIKAFKGVGATVSDMEHAHKDLNSAQSPQAMRAVIKKYIDLMESRIEAIGDQYNRGMQLGKPRTGVSLLSSHTQELLKEMKGEASGKDGKHMVGEPQAAPAPKDAPMEGARKAPDGHWYVPDPDRPGKYLMVQ